MVYYTDGSQSNNYVSVGNFVPGTSYIIISGNNTDFTTIGATGSNTGIIFLAMNTGSGGSGVGCPSIQNLINASFPQDTILIPSGNFILGVGGANITITQTILLAGAGTGNTTIYIPAGGPTFGLFVFSNSAATCSGFTIVPSGSAGGFEAFAVNIPIYGWRITNINYNPWPTSDEGYFVSVFQNAGGWGLIDNCTITTSGNDEWVEVSRWNTNSWLNPLNRGSAGSLFIENNTWHGNAGYVTDTLTDGYTVVRYNLITDNTKIDGHGFATSVPAGSVRNMEIYGNVWTYNLAFNMLAVEVRGGNGVMFNNFYGHPTLNAVYLEDYGYQQQGGNYNYMWQTLNNWPLCKQIGSDYVSGVMVAGTYQGGTGTGFTTWNEIAGVAPFYLWNNPTINSTAGGHSGNPQALTRTLKVPITNYGTFHVINGPYATGTSGVAISGSDLLYAGDAIAFSGDTTSYLITGVIGANIYAGASKSGWIGFTQWINNSGLAVAIMSTDSTGFYNGPQTRYIAQCGALQPNGTSFIESDIIGSPDASGVYDFFWQTSGQFSGNFDGTRGVNTGYLNQMNSLSASVQGVGFVAIDQGTWNNAPNALAGAYGASSTTGIQYSGTWSGQGVLYTYNTGISGWQNIYTPFNYPHPAIVGRPIMSARAPGSTITIYQP